MKKFALAAVLAALVPVAAHAQDADAGKAVFNICKACHAIGEGAKNQVGPYLTGVVGRKSATAEGFNYSEGMKNANLTWDEATLDVYLKDPKAKVPGNKMVFAGVKDDQKRKDLIAYLKTFSK